MPLYGSFSPLRSHFRLPNAASQLVGVRHASLNSAINRGLRKSQALESSRSSDLPRRDTVSDDRLFPRERRYLNRREDDSRREIRDFDKAEFIRTGQYRTSPRQHQSEGKSSPWRDERPEEKTYSSFRKQPSGEVTSTFPSNHFPPAVRPRPRPKKRRRGRKHHFSDTEPERIKSYVVVPPSIPYTTPASEFIYGTSAVEAAIRCSQRKLYKLYIYQGADEKLSASKIALRKLALSTGIPVKMAFADWDRLMDKMSAGRPHNGCILEASPLPRLPVRSFGAVSSLEQDHFRVVLDRQSREEAEVNGTNDRIPILQSSLHQTRRYPFALLLDGVVDPGNLGAIIRSAYYLGIDAVVFAGRHSAPLSPVTIKASAGAAENMTLLNVSNELAFIQESKANGWKFYAADAPGPGSVYMDTLTAPGGGNGVLTQSPAVLMMGSEGSGLSSHIKAQADSIVSIPGARLSSDIGVASDPARVDSLNVSVAAALLMEMFLRVPLAVSEVPKKG